MTKKEKQIKYDEILTILKTNQIINSNKCNLNKIHKQHIETNVDLSKHPRLEKFFNEMIKGGYISEIKKIENTLQKYMTDEKHKEELMSINEHALPNKIFNLIKGKQQDYSFIQNETKILKLEDGKADINPIIFSLYGVLNLNIGSKLTIDNNSQDEYWTLFVNKKEKTGEALCLYIDTATTVEDIVNMYEKTLEYLGY